jgi:hypothetical protein
VISDVGMQLWCVYTMPIIGELCLILILGLRVTYSFNTYLNKVHELVWYCCVLTHKLSKSYIVVVVLSVETNG